MRLKREGSLGGVSFSYGRTDATRGRAETDEEEEREEGANPIPNRRNISSDTLFNVRIIILPSKTSKAI